MNNDPAKITYFAQTDSRGKRDRFGIKAADRTKHMYVIGKTGMGKSTLLENMIVQDIQNGEGLTFIDPHGGSAEKILEYIPEDRIDDVLYFAPFDLDNPVSFNVMEDVGYDKRHLVVSGLMSTFRKVWADQWSSRMEYILTNTLLALLEYPDATLLGINKMYTDKVFRKKVVENIKDPLVKAFWTEEYAQYTDRYTQEATPAIQNKIGQFTGNPLIRNIIGQPKSTFDIREMMDQKKIIICNLSKGLVGEVNANLLGSMLITKIYLAAMSRADSGEQELNKLPNFYFYVDEFQSFANESFADILSEARKYKLNLTIAHQYIEQMSEEVRAAVFGNVGTMVTFRVGAYDADVLEKEFSPQFYAQDLVNLGFTQIYLKLMIDGVGSQPFSATTLPPIETPPISFKKDVISRSQEKFGEKRDKVEQDIADWHGPKLPPASNKPTQQQGREQRKPQGDQQRKPQNKFQEKKDSFKEEKAAFKAVEPSSHKEQLKVISDKISKESKQGNNQPNKKPYSKNKPAGNTGNKNDLKSALADLMKDSVQEKKPEEKKQENQPSPRLRQAGKVEHKKPEEKKAPVVEVKKETPQPKETKNDKEISEKVLREVLDVKEGETK